jgi:hypothetical protein
LITNIERPVVCSLPLAIGLLAARASIVSLPAGVQLSILVICGAVVYAASTFASGRSELRAITAAFRSP